MKDLTKKFCLSIAVLSVFFAINVFADSPPALTNAQIDQGIISGNIATATPSPSASTDDQSSNTTVIVVNNDIDGDGITNENDPDVDNDGINNQSDPDDDNDGVIDTVDAYPYDPARAVAAGAVINNNNGVGGNVINNVDDRRR